jgi:tetratricopeptide (TPR) repeat protein
MPKDYQIDPRKNFVPRFLPWLLGGVMFVVYGLTLNHWVSLQNLAQVAAVSGWTWQPQLLAPLTFLVTLPFRCLPTAHVPMALNVFSAFCAAATLAVLARSVAILPHDRTEMERTRERTDFSFLTGWAAWAPPMVAVIFAGLQLGFWEHATSFASETIGTASLGAESFDLLWFAVILWQLLEYRLDEAEWRLYLASFLFCAGITENWAMVGFIPLFLTVLIWLRRLDFFNLSFLTGMMVSGLAGLLFFLLLPLVAKFSAFYPVTIWDVLKPNWQVDWWLIKMVESPPARHALALMSLTSLLPAFVMSIRWSATFGDSSRLGATLVNYLMHAVNTILFGVLLWAAFDPPFSAAQLVQAVMPGAPALTLYYVAALCIGYYCGYVLLIFGKAPVPTRRNPRPDTALPKPLVWLCPVIVGVTLAGTVVAAGLLIYKNAPIVRAMNGDSLSKYAQFTTQTLPRGGAILLCDSDDSVIDQPTRALLIRAELVREGRAQDFPVVDSQSLNWAPYHKYLHQRFPKSWPPTLATNNAAGLNALQIFVLLNQLSRSNTLCYLNPSFGYYFEQFYLEPHGLIYTLKPYAKDELLPPPADTNLLAENESFWTQVLESSRPAIEQAQHPPDYNQMTGALGWGMKHLHVTSEPDPNALFAGAIYSRGLNYLGVQVQRNGDLAKAASLFADAQELNTNNVVATINLDFNKLLRAGAPTPVNPGEVSPDRFGKARSWNEVMGDNGPFDQTSFCFVYGSGLMQQAPPLMHQAAVYFNRVYQLAPDNLAARLYLAQIYILGRLPENAMAYLREPLAQPARFALTDYNSTELNVLAACVYFQKGKDAEGAALLEKEIARHPDDETLLMVSAQVFNMRGLYTNALDVINRKLARTPDDPVWLDGKAIVCVQLGNYSEAVTALNRYLEMQTNDPSAYYYRGFANLKSDHLEAAYADFHHLQAVYTNNFQVAYGLGEIAWRHHDTNEAVRNFRIFVANAPTNTVELKSVRERLTQLDRK